MLSGFVFEDLVTCSGSIQFLLICSVRVLGCDKGANDLEA